MRAGREKRGLLRKRYRGSSATPTTPLPQIYTSIHQRRNWCRPLKRRKFVSSLLVTDGSQGKPLQNCSAKSCKIATNIVILIKFCACIFKVIIIHTQEVTGSSPAVSTKKFLISYEIRNFFCLYPQIVTRHFGVFRLTQTVTQKPRGQESTGEGRMASSVPLRLFFVGYMVWLMTLPMVSAASRFIPSVAWV